MLSYQNLRKIIVDEDRLLNINYKKVVCVQTRPVIALPCTLWGFYPNVLLSKNFVLEFGLDGCCTKDYKKVVGVQSRPVTTKPICWSRQYFPGCCLETQKMTCVFSLSDFIKLYQTLSN